MNEEIRALLLAAFQEKNIKKKLDLLQKSVELEEAACGMGK